MEHTASINALPTRDTAQALPDVHFVGEGTEEIRRDLTAFLTAWHDDSPTVEVHTSGSTGTPKPMQADKRRMEASARLTCDFLGLRPGDSALLCMPLRYIAGRMVVVRALVRGLHLLVVPPSAHPLARLEAIPVFAAMTPMQVHATLQVPEEAMRLRAVRHLIIGGGAVDEALQSRLSDFPHAVWSTYGMTETLSHIALRRLNGPEADAWYTPFPGVTVSLSSEGTLVIDAPQVNPEQLVTHDLAEIDGQGRFRILGRTDNTINSGGIKVQIEAVEAALRPHLPVPFAVTSVPDARLGEAVTLLYTGEASAETLLAHCARLLSPYDRPRHCYCVDALPHTATGKPARAALRQQALQAHTQERAAADNHTV